MASPLKTVLGNVTNGLSGQVLSVPTANGTITVPNSTGPTWTNYTMGPSLSATSSASIQANGTIKCKDLEIDDVSMKGVLKQISTQVGLFIPPNIETLNVPAVQQAYTDYRNALDAFMKAKDNLDLMVDLCRQSSKEE